MRQMWSIKFLQAARGSAFSSAIAEDVIRPACLDVRLPRVT